MILTKMILVLVSSKFGVALAPRRQPHVPSLLLGATNSFGVILYGAFAPASKGAPVSKWWAYGAPKLIECM